MYTKKKNINNSYIIVMIYFFCSVNKMEIYVKLLLYIKISEEIHIQKMLYNNKRKLKRHKRFIKEKRNRRKMITIDKDNTKILACLIKIYIRRVLLLTLIFTINKMQ